MTEDVVYRGVPLTPIAGKVAVTAWVRGFEEKPPGRLHIHHQVASGDVVMNERSDAMVINGRMVTLPICAVFEMRHGRIVAWREYFDVAPAKAASASRARG